MAFEIHDSNHPIFDLQDKIKQLEKKVARLKAELHTSPVRTKIISYTIVDEKVEQLTQKKIRHVEKTLVKYKAKLAAIQNPHRELDNILHDLKQKISEDERKLAHTKKIQSSPKVNNSFGQTLQLLQPLPELKIVQQSLTANKAKLAIIEKQEAQLKLINNVVSTTNSKTVALAKQINELKIKLNSSPNRVKVGSYTAVNKDLQRPIKKELKQAKSMLKKYVKATSLLMHYQQILSEKFALGYHVFSDAQNKSVDKDSLQQLNKKQLEQKIELHKHWIPEFAQIDELARYHRENSPKITITDARKVITNKRKITKDLNKIISDFNETIGDMKSDEFNASKFKLKASDVSKKASSEEESTYAHDLARVGGFLAKAEVGKLQEDETLSLTLLDETETTLLVDRIKAINNAKLTEGIKPLTEMLKSLKDNKDFTLQSFFEVIYNAEESLDKTEFTTNLLERLKDFANKAELGEFQAELIRIKDTQVEEGKSAQPEMEIFFNAIKIPRSLRPEFRAVYTQLCKLDQQQRRLIGVDSKKQNRLYEKAILNTIVSNLLLQDLDSHLFEVLISKSTKRIHNGGSKIISSLHKFQALVGEAEQGELDDNFRKFLENHGLKKDNIEKFAKLLEDKNNQNKEVSNSPDSDASLSGSEISIASLVGT